MKIVFFAPPARFKLGVSGELKGVGWGETGIRLRASGTWVLSLGEGGSGSSRFRRFRGLFMLGLQ